MIGMSACVETARKTTPDVSNINLEVEIRRFEQDLFQLDTNQMEASLAELEKQYPEFSRLYFGQILGVPPKAQEQEAYIKGFINFPEVRRLYDTCTIVYGNFDGIQQELEQAFRYYQYYFPDRKIPQVTTYLSEYSIGAFIYGDDQLAVGLDFFLGANYPYEKYNPGNPNFSNYLIRTFNRDHLVFKTIKPLVEDITGAPRGGSLLDLMIHNGKQWYLTDLLLPNTSDTVKLEMTPTQVDWLKDNELEMWAFLLKEKLLYDSDWSKIRKYVEYSPGIPQMHPEAPGRSANWIGLQIVRAYMDNVPDAKLEELLSETSAQRILDRSRYKPRQ